MNALGVKFYLRYMKHVWDIIGYVHGICKPKEMLKHGDFSGARFEKLLVPQV